MGLGLREEDVFCRLKWIVGGVVLTRLPVELHCPVHHHSLVILPDLRLIVLPTVWVLMDIVLVLQIVVVVYSSSAVYTDSTC